MNNLTELRAEIARRLDKHRASSTRYGDEYKNPVRKGYDLALTEVLELIDDDTPSPLPELPAPTGWRGSGMPTWGVATAQRRTVGAAISPVAPFNLDDPDVPAIEIYLHDEASEWTHPEARAFALAILAALDWREDTDDPDDDQGDDNPGPRDPGSDPDHETDRARDAANEL